MTDKKTRKIRIVSLDATKRAKSAGGKCEIDPGCGCYNARDCCRVQCPCNPDKPTRPPCTCKPMCNCNPEYHCTCYPKPVPPLPKAQGGKGQKKQKLPKGGKESHQTFFKIAKKENRDSDH